MTLSENTKATLLLCARLVQREEAGAKPLTTREYAGVTNLLKEQSMQPGDLLSSAGRARISEFHVAGVTAERIEQLLDRGSGLGALLEQWEDQGIWVISLDEADYPSRYLNYLRNEAPPVLYGVGDRRMLSRGGLAIVGSREAGEEDLAFARKLGLRCAQQDVVVISGAAKGIDSEAMMASLEEAGRAMGVLAEGLGRAAAAPQYHDAIVNNRLTLISPYEPESRWFAFKAMGRNKLIYALADAAVVVAASDESGGTWSGATEALKLGRVPLYVKASGVVAPGNEKLLQAGARPFLQDDWQDLSRLMTQAAPNGLLFPQT